jgi:hypothetical protein
VRVASPANEEREGIMAGFPGTAVGLSKWLKYAGAVALVALLPALPAQAGSCAAGSVCVIELENTNVLGVNIDIDVTIDNSGAVTVLTVAFHEDNLTNTPLGIDQFAWNDAALATSMTAGWSLDNCSTNPAPCQMDGFGNFAVSASSPGGNDLSGITFTLASLVTTFADNPNGGEFAAHIRYSGGCSGFVSDGAAVRSANTACSIEPPLLTPEPGSLSLLGIALLALAGFARSRRA